MSSITSFFSSFLPTIQADAAAEDKPAEEKPTEDEPQAKSEAESSEEEPAEKAEKAEEAEEEEEPEDEHSAIREECKNTEKCAPLVKHFEHCQEKVEGGKGFKGEDCVEEMCKSDLYPAFTLN
ncbi:hypothetical protein D9757_008421 [Collybiopsis confluens]|uniref:Ubiquinol-cytochrome C reductase hinge domain-containing protein n=1 Tax=Collybiopsis confluens TaxID=2823264 RepID=A0A8H5HH95_9AGAR|nr:hypothetical protein D9757_013328 [Collybiopsis confluens]KAF5383324.1 hypothetical protein D9757_008421 [Collybiopsis confluens]